MNKELSIKIKNLSFFATILVVVLHAYNYSSKNYVCKIEINQFIQKFISYGICNIAVPLFFIISGFLFFFNFKSTLNNWIYKYKSRIKSLVIPFVIWCVGWMIILFLIELTPFGKDFFKNMVISKFSLKELYRHTFKYPIPFQLWYISALIKLVIISPLIYYCVRLLKKITIPIIFIAWILGIINFPLVFFTLGAYLAINNIKFNKKIELKVCIVLLIVFVSLVTIRTVLSINNNLDIDILNKIIIGVGILGIWYVYDYIPILSNQYIKVAQYSIFIYLFHEPLQSFMYRILFKIIPRNNINELIFYFVIPYIVISICIFVAYVIKRIMPRTYGVLTGGR